MSCALSPQIYPSQAVVPLHKVWHCVPDDEWIILLRQKAGSSFANGQWSANPTAEPTTSSLFSLLDQIETYR